MDEKTIVLLVVIGFLLVAFIYLACGFIRICEERGEFAPKKLNEAVTEILKLEEMVGIVKKLRYEESCKKALLEEIHLMFFFEEFKDAPRMKERFEAKINSLLAGDFVDEEDRRLAQMYKDIVEDVRDRT